MADPNVTDEFAGWYGELPEAEQEAVRFVVDLLAEQGVKLGFPYSSAIKGSKYPLRELRAQAGKRALRVFYGFDPKREAWVLIGGAKSDDGFYDRMIPVAEKLWTEYIGD